MKAYTGADVWLHLFLISVLDEGECSASRPGPLTPGRDPRHPLYRRLSGSQSRSGLFLKNGKYLSPAGIQTADRPSRSQVITPNALYQLVDTCSVTLHFRTCSGRNLIIPLTRRPNTDSAPNKPVTLPRNQLLIRYAVTSPVHTVTIRCYDTR